MKIGQKNQSGKFPSSMEQYSSQTTSLQEIARQIAILIVRQHRRRMPREGKKNA